MNFSPQKQTDLFISSMVLEHLPTEEEHDFIVKAEKCLVKNGTFMALVPGNMRFFGIEDEIAGHYRRYDRDSLFKLLDESKFKDSSVTGLTFPLSNFLLPLSNFLVRRSESFKLNLNSKERTLLSGHRNVIFKSKFPRFFRLILNKFTLSPFYFFQWCFKNNDNCLILFIQATKI
jgi:hypothetical protein